MFILCSEDALGARLIAPLDAAVVLQVPGGAAVTSEPAARATIEYGVRGAKVRDVVVLAHRGCRFCGAPPGDARAQVLAQATGMTRDPLLPSLFRDHGVLVRYLWVDETSGDVGAIRGEDPRFEPLARAELDQLFASLEEPQRALDGER